MEQDDNELFSSIFDNYGMGEDNSMLFPMDSFPSSIYSSDGNNSSPRQLNDAHLKKYKVRMKQQ